MSERPKPFDFEAHPAPYETPIPRAPRIPSDLAPATRDTEPITGQPADMHDETDENTPPDGPFAIRQVLKKLEKFDAGFNEMRGHCRVTADCSLETLSAVQSLTGKLAALEKRVRAIELADRWVPRLAWLFTTIIAVIALLRTFKG